MGHPTEVERWILPQHPKALQPFHPWPHPLSLPLVVMKPPTWPLSRAQFTPVLACQANPTSHKHFLGWWVPPSACLLQQAQRDLALQGKNSAHRLCTGFPKEGSREGGRVGAGWYPPGQRGPLCAGMVTGKLYKFLFLLFNSPGVTPPRPKLPLRPWL